MIGETLYKKSLTNLGIDTIENLDNMKVDLYIMRIYSIDHQIEMSVPKFSEAKKVSISTEIIRMITLDKLGLFQIKKL